MAAGAGAEECLFVDFFPRDSEVMLGTFGVRFGRVFGTKLGFCTFLAWHALHVCLPFSPDRRLSKKAEKLAMGSHWWHTAHVQDPRVLFRHCKHTFRLSFFLCHAERLKYSCVNFFWHTEHCFFAAQERQTRYMLHRGF